MPLIMHFIKAPRFFDPYIEEYISLPFADLQKINSYYDWKERVKAGKECCSLKEWSGFSKEELPHEEVVGYYKEHYKWNPFISDWDCEKTQVKSIFADLARLSRMEQLANWAMKYVAMGKLEEGHHYEVSKEQLKDLYRRLRSTQLCIDYVGDELTVIDPSIAKEFMPLFDAESAVGRDDRYNEFYASQLVEAYSVVLNILISTDFEKESIYFVASNM